MRALLLVSAFLVVACDDPTRAGDRCIDDVDCPDPMRCYALEGVGSRRCLSPCDPASVILCSEVEHSSGGACAALPASDGSSSDPGVCLVGGTVQLGRPCAASADCITGAVCVSEGGASACRLVCDVSAPTTCAMGQICRPLAAASNPSRGYCVTAPAPMSDAGT